MGSVRAVGAKAQSGGDRDDHLSAARHAMTAPLWTQRSASQQRQATALALKELGTYLGPAPTPAQIKATVTLLMNGHPALSREALLALQNAARSASTAAPNGLEAELRAQLSAPGSTPDAGPQPSAPTPVANQGEAVLSASIAPQQPVRTHRSGSATAANGRAAIADGIERAGNTFELASRALEAGHGETASAILNAGAAELRHLVSGADATQARVLDALAANMETRAAGYGHAAPAAARQQAERLASVSWQARRLAEELAQRNPGQAALLDAVGLESRLQAEILLQSADGTDVLLGRGVARTYRAIVDASFDRAIHDSGAIHNFLTGSRAKLQADRRKMNEVFDAVERRMERDGVSFDRAWNLMFEDNHLANQTELPSFPTAHEAAVFLRDHQVTRGLLMPMADLARGLTTGNLSGIDEARARLVSSLRENGQWVIARAVLDDLQKNARSGQGRTEARALNDSERREWWSQKAGEFAREDLPVLLLTGLVSGGVGWGAGALASAAGWGTRAVRITQIAVELGSFVPTERVLSDVMNDRRADWSGSGLARDYALTVGSFALFRALGIGWRALRAPKAVAPAGTVDAAATPLGRATRVPANEAPENIRALTRENESARTLAQNGYTLEQNPMTAGGRVPGAPRPDYRIGGELFDNYAPQGSSARNIWTNVQGKVEAEQARRIVLNLDDSAVDLAVLRRQFTEWPIPGLEQLLVIKNGKVFAMALARVPGTAPLITPKGYPHREN